MVTRTRWGLPNLVMGLTLFDKLWNEHEIQPLSERQSLIYIDLFPHLYSILKLKNVKNVFKIILNGDGIHKLPLDL